MQAGTFAGVGALFNWTPDVEGTYTIQLTVDDGLSGLSSVDTANALLSTPSGSPYFFQGDRIRFWDYIQGNLIPRKKE